MKKKPLPLRTLKVKSAGPLGYYLTMPCPRGADPFAWFGVTVDLDNNGDLTKREYAQVCAYLGRALRAYRKAGGK